MGRGIGDWIVRRAQRRPEATALVDCDTSVRLSYRELSDSVAALAAALHELGVRRGDRVALLMENSPGFVRMLFAAANLGAIAVPINFRLAAPEVGYVLADSGAVALAVSDRFAGLAGAALAEGEHGVRRVITESPAEGLSTTTLEALLATPERRGPDPSIADGDTCVIMYTSGTTGRPKGVMLTHGNMLWNAIQVLTYGEGLGSTAVSLVALPMFHIGALGGQVLPILYGGGTVLTVRAFDPRRTLELIQAHRVSTMSLVPVMWAAVGQVPDFAEFDTSSLRYVICGGAPCPLPVIEFYRRHGWTFQEGFGMTETAPGALGLDADFVVSHAGSVGRPLMHVDIRIVDVDEHDVPAGEVGELVLRGPNVFAGYWGRPVETAEAFRGGWFHTGDLARMDADGFVTLVDRKKDMIISGGENVYPIEVEQVLHAHEAVADVAVIGAPDPRWGETVVAVVVRSTDVDEVVGADKLIAYTRDRLAHFKCPTRVEFIDELPRNATGKVLKRALRERFTGSTATVGR